MGDFNQEGGKKINFDLPKLDKQVIQMLELDQNENEESKIYEISYDISYSEKSSRVGDERMD
jgi:hypothetical protein